MLNTKIVRVGADHDCCTCRKTILKGSPAVRHSRPAATYREKLHANRGLVCWYHHEACITAAVNARPVDPEDA